MISKTEFIESFDENVKQLWNNREVGGCIYYTLNTDDKNTYALVIGWQPTEDPDDEYCDKGFRLATKFGYQPRNSMMQCDFDVDWLLPTTDEGDVDDNLLIELYPGMILPSVAEEIWNRAQDYDNIVNWELI